jgi:O-methyltransferase / aklanonic acid methyltransferase
VPDIAIATKQMIEQLFNGAAKTYNRIGPNIFTQFGDRLVERMPFTHGAHVLDVATGNGAVLLPAGRSVGAEGHVIGIDLSGEILQEARSAVHKAGLTNVELRKMDAEHLEFPDQAFDVVTCAFSIFLFPNIEAALREIYRVCKPGGYVGISIFDKTPPPFNPGLPMLIQQFMAHQRAVLMPQPFAYAPEEVEALLSRFDFRSIETYSEANDIIYASEEDWWEFLLTIGSGLTILGMDEETRTRFKEEYLVKLRPLLAQDGLHISIAVVYAVAQR